MGTGVGVLVGVGVEGTGVGVDVGVSVGLGEGVASPTWVVGVTVVSTGGVGKGLGVSVGEGTATGMTSAEVARDEVAVATDVAEAVGLGEGGFLPPAPLPRLESPQMPRASAITATAPPPATMGTM